MHHETALPCVAQAQPSSTTAVSNGEPCSSRAQQSACSQPAAALGGALGGTFAAVVDCPGPKLDMTPREEQPPTRESCGHVTDLEQIQVAAVGQKDAFCVQGYAAHQRASEQEQYPHFFAWIRLQKSKQPHIANDQQLQVSQSSSTDSSTYMRCVSACSKQRPAGSAVRQPKGPQPASWRSTACLKNNKQAGVSASRQQEQTLLFDKALPKQHRHALRPASAVDCQAQLQICHQQAKGCRPQSAMGWSGTQATAANSWQQTSRNSPVSKGMPCWLSEAQSQAPGCLAAAARPPNHRTTAVHQLHHSDTPGIHTPSSPVWECMLNSTRIHSSEFSSRPLRPVCSTPDSNSDLQHQQGSHHSQHAAQLLFQRLPLADGAAVDRHTLQLLMLGLQCELSRLGPPSTLHVPDLTDNGEPTEQNWSAHEQVAPELQVWDKLTSELCRQARVECSQRGVLLLTAVTRQRQLLHSALSACDSMYTKMQEAAGASQQLLHTIGSLETALQSAQQQRIQLEANLQDARQELAVTLQQLQQQRDKMRKGRFHLIAEEVENAKRAIEARWMGRLIEQLQQIKGQHVAELAAGTQQCQEKMLQLVREAASDDVADTIRVKIMAESTS